MLLTKLPSEDYVANFLKPIYVLERFGAAFRDKSELNKTQLQMVTKLRWDSFNNYLNWLMAKEFLQYRKQDKTETYFLTEKGRKSLNILAIFIACIK